ncbi:integral membrane sensor signal transduction histidine kinase protein [Halorhabdus tiamatea SARL4B]|uniref:Conserved hypothetical membrane protein n=1 Tax=Halorhabdus tiamatea SARL4B TaxID=1033806 RepID=F7PIN5_9EURY|nr:hypothetical protein [Halorhabdus tiamatea]ERJ06998.1 integral membrane sensor signal transduction histidine kinase protein [Halorhabdus tiamatea SARL4B]CCQ34769.1 conserved hypothetical membrane protein [Halorhabdus tiamatea SARL4B]
MERHHLYGATFGIVGLLLAGIQLVHATEQTDVAVAILVDGIPFAMLGLTLSFAGYWLATSTEYEADLPRIAAWAVGGTLLFTAVVALMLFSQRVAPGTLQRVTYTAIDGVTVGAIAGTLVGLYDARSRHHRRRLQCERDRTEAFARKAADLNNYGRALAQSSSVEEVGAFCIQAVSSLLGLDQTAYVEVEPDNERIVSSTVAAVSDDEIRRLARTGGDQDDVVVYGHEHTGDPSTTFEHFGSMTVRLDNTVGTTGVLVTVGDITTELSAEDEQLLELLSSHAGMVLDQLYRRREPETASSNGQT